VLGVGVGASDVVTIDQKQHAVMVQECVGQPSGLPVQHLAGGEVDTNGRPKEALP
jgi:hypothetical protein